MKITRFFLTSLILIFMISTIHPAPIYKKGETYNGFRLVDKRFVKEVNAECFYFEHIKSGAHLLKIASNDINKTFAIAFKTDPESDCGTPHMLEHSLLNGSKNFPVKSPFDILMKGSLKTYLNASTGSDITAFPFASMNNKDYFNLMHVYLDAVFNPLIYSDPRILKQEGWHYEMEKVDGPITYKGVVYNEMKGAFSDPNRELGYLTNKFLFPDNGYKYSSGGYPPIIPRQTYEAFVNYHKKYYHPSNSYIFLYGNADTEQELAFIDSEYLSNYKKENIPEVFPIQKPFRAMKEVSTYYAVPEGGNTNNQTFISLNFVVGESSDQALVMELTTIGNVLVNQESGAIRLALQKAGIGKEVRSYVDDKRQNVFNITVQNANPSDKDKFKEIVMNCLREASEKGIDKKAIEGSINRTEFSLREGANPQKGLTYAFQAFGGWFFTGDPFLSLEYEKPLKVLKTALTTDLLEKTIKKEILSNNHALLLVLEPKPGLEKENNAKIEKELQKYKESLSEKDKENLVKETKELQEYQKREDSPEAAATIPMLERKDINPKAEYFSMTEKKIADVPVLHYEDFCNNIVYSKLLFNMRVLPSELIPYASLLSQVLGDQNTQNYSYNDLEKALNIYTGGFSSSLANYLVNKDDQNMQPEFVITAKVMNKKGDKLAELASEIINKTRYADLDRLKTILVQTQAQLDAQVKKNGMGFAQIRATSYFSNFGSFNELTNGLEYYWFLTDLVTNFDKKSKEISDNLAKTADLLFNKKNLTIAVVSSKEDYPAFTQNLEKIVSSLPDNKVELQSWKFNFEKKNEGFVSASKVQYVTKGYNFKKLGYGWNGKMLVLSQIIARDWLQNRIRVLGGAYGGFSNFSSNGNVLFSSYRDPNLKETLDNFDAIPEYLDKLEVDDNAMTRYIIGTISSLDNPLTVPQKGNIALQYYIEKTTPETVQADRDAVLSVTLKDVKNFKKMVSDILAQKTFCVYGNEEKVKSQKDLFGNVRNLTK